MSAKLDSLHKRLSARRCSWDEKQQRWSEFKVYSKELSDCLPFNWHIVGASNPYNNQNGFSYACDHIVLCEDVSVGRFKRVAGDALCKPIRKFNGNLWVSPSKDAVPSCKACLERAEKLVGVTNG